MIKTILLTILVGTAFLVGYVGLQSVPGAAGQRLVVAGNALSNQVVPTPISEIQANDAAGAAPAEPVDQPGTAGFIAPDAPEPNGADTEAVLFNFVDGEPAWYTVDDNVMGGISQSVTSVDPESGLLTFAGTVSLENNGGFASARSRWVPYDLSSFKGIRLRLRGDGQLYRLRVYAQETGPDVAYTAVFATEADRWIEVYVPFAEMVPLYRGFVVNNAGPLQPDQIRSFGLMIADKQQGAFELQVDWIKAQVQP